MAFFLVVLMLYLFIVMFRSYLLPACVAGFCGALQVSSRVLFGLLVLSWKFLVIVISVQGLLLILMFMSVGVMDLLALMLVLMVMVLSL